MQAIVVVISILILLLNVLFGLWRGAKRSMLRLITLALAAVAAFILAGILPGVLADAVVPLLEDMLSSNETLTAFVQGNPEMSELIYALSEMLVAPLLFLVCYMLLKPITLIIYFILRCVLRAKKNRTPVSKLGGAGIGLVIGLIGLVIFSVPVIGYTDLVSRSVAELENGSEESSLGELTVYNEDYIKPIAGAPIAKQAYTALGDKLFDSLTTTRWNGEDTSLETEWFAIIGVLGEAQKLSEKPMAEYGESESQTVHAMIDKVGESRILTYLGGSTLSGISEAWLNGQPYCGIEAINMGNANAQLMVNGLLRVFATTDSELFVSDLEFFADLFDLLTEYEMFSLLTEGTDTETFVDQMVSSGFLEAAYSLINSNARMEPVSKAIHDVGMNVLVTELGLPEEYKEKYGQLMDDMTVALQECVTADGTIDVDQLHTSLNQAFADSDVEITEAVAEVIAGGLSNEFTAEELAGGLTPEQITDRLIERFSGTENLESVIPEGAIPDGLLPEGTV